MSDSHLSRSERVRTPSRLRAEECECKASKDHRCTDKVIRCRARMTWHFERGWPDAPAKDATPTEIAKRAKHGIVYNTRGKRVSP